MTKIKSVVQHVVETDSIHFQSRYLFSLFRRRQCKYSGKASSCSLLSVFLAVASLLLPAQEAICDSGVQARADALAMSPLAVEIEGELEALYEDYADGSHKLQYYLKANGKRHKIEFERPPAHIKPGTPVLLSARERVPQASAEFGVESEAVLVASGEEAIMYLSSGAGDGSPQPVQGGVIGTPFHTTGEQPTVVLLVNFQDTATISPYTLSEAQQAVFGTVSDFLREASDGQTWLAGDVHGWFTLPTDSTCNTDDIGNLADQAAMDAGIDLSGYGRFVYVFYGSAVCSWNGAANLWVYPSRAWIRGSTNPQIIAHEIGHNLGLSHSYLLDCGDTVLGEDCKPVADDKFDTMGSANDPAHYNAVHKERLGWLDSADIETASVSGTYYLSVFELSNAVYPRVLKIPKEVDPGGLGTTWYYIEYRQALGFDSFIAGNGNVENGVLIHTGADFDTSAPMLLDMTPSSSLLSFQDRSDPALTTGNSFHDPAAGVTITTEMTEGNLAAVGIEFGTQTCIPKAPGVVMSPVSQSVPSGTGVQYTLTLTNRDSNVCPQSTFDFGYAVPTGWIGSLSQSSLGLMPTESGTITLQVTSPQDSVGGAYDITMTVEDTAETIHAGSAGASYEVVDSCTAVAPQLVLYPASQNSDAGKTLVYTGTLSNNDGASCGASTFDLSITSLPAGWSGSLSTQTMLLAPGDSGLVNLSVTSDPAATAGGYTLQLGVSDALDPTHSGVVTADYQVNAVNSNGDSQAPSAPSSLTASANKKQVMLSWPPSSDNVAVAGYNVYRDGARIATIIDAGYTDRSVQDGIIYEFTVTAYDAAGNVSLPSNPVMIGLSAGGSGAGGKNGGGKGKK